MFGSIKKMLGIKPNYANLKEAYDAGDYELVFEVQKARSEKKEPSAMYCLATMYKNGVGTAVNTAKYIELLRESSDLGYLDACWEYVQLLTEESVTKNIKQIEHYLVIIGQANKELSVTAWKALGNTFSNGKNISPDVFKALKYYQNAAELGDIESINSIGCIYKDGVITEKNTTLAANYFNISANSGNSDGMLFLGMLYRDGDGVPKSIEKAIEYLTKASEIGNTLAMYFLAEIYSEKTYSKKNDVLAYKWYNLSAIEQDFSKSARDNLELELSQEQVELAQHMCNEWIANKEKVTQ